MAEVTVNSGIENVTIGIEAVAHTHTIDDVTDITASAAELNILDGATLTTTELNYVDGVTSSIQTQLNSKASSSHTHAVGDITGVTASASELNILDGATLTTTELNYVDGVTSSIQTQLNSKASSSHSHNISGEATFSLVDGHKQGTVSFSNFGSVPKVTASVVSASSSPLNKLFSVYVYNVTETGFAYQVYQLSVNTGTGAVAFDNTATTSLKLNWTAN